MTFVCNEWGWGGVLQSYELVAECQVQARREEDKHPIFSANILITCFAMAVLIKVQLRACGGSQIWTSEQV